VTIEEEWKKSIDTAVSRYGRLDVLVNNAGISGSFHSDIMSTEAWDKLMEVNAKGVFLGIKHAIPEMRKVGGGSIVNISSISGFVGQYLIHMGYNASKGAVRILTKSAAIQYAKEGIRVNSVHPGLMPPMRSSIATADPGVRKQMLAKVPMGREGRGRGGRLRCVVPGFRRGFVHNRNRVSGGRRIYCPLALHYLQGNLPAATTYEKEK
jgi:NAD(P)-dependent dehydrogenase (short-subunit alcohol dehydrogenase family)